MSGPLAVTLDAFTDYFRESAHVWERMALTRARVLHGTGDFGFDVTEAIRDVLGTPVDSASITRDVLAMRRRLKESARYHATSKSACPGGLADIEFIVQTLALPPGPRRARCSSTPERLGRLLETAQTRLGLIPRAEAATDLRDSYDFIPYRREPVKAGS